MTTRQRYVALAIGWLAGGMVFGSAYLLDVQGWELPIVIGLTGFAVGLAAIRWPFV